MATPPDVLGDLFELKSSAFPTLHEVTGEQYLLRSRQIDSGPEPSGHRFWILDGNGRVLQAYAPEFYCDCEYGLPVVYEMKDGTLFKYSGRSNDAWTDALCEWQAEVVCVAWKQLDQSDSPARQLLEILRERSLFEDEGQDGPD